MSDETVKCIRCDEPVSTKPFEPGITLTFDQEAGAVRACEECEEIVEERDHW